MEVQRLEPAIRRILTSPSVDLSTISAKRVRKQLAADGESESWIKDNKTEIDGLIAQIYESTTGGNVVAAGTGGATPSRKPNDDGGHANGQSTSTSQFKRKREEDAASAFYAPPSSQPQALAVKKSKPQTNGVSRSHIMTDAELARQLSMEINGRSTRGGHSAPHATKGKSNGKKIKRSRATISDDDDDDGSEKPKKKTKGGLGKEYILSEALANLTGHAMLSRPQAVKKIWEHIKGNNLQNPSDKREILCDDMMKSVFNVDRLGMFNMNKRLGDHLFEPGETA